MGLFSFLVRTKKFIFGYFDIVYIDSEERCLIWMAFSVLEKLKRLYSLGIFTVSHYTQREFFLKRLANLEGAIVNSCLLDLTL